jgi:hypothetical protein
VAVEIPNFAQLLAPFIQSVSQEAVPALLCQLERSAADRYRSWAANAAGGEAAGLLACAEREDEIARRVEAVLPASAEQALKIDSAMPGAREAYLNVFRDRSAREQYRIQANAERQGAAAWRGLAAQLDDPSVRDVLEGCARLEEESADHLDALLAAARA